MEFARFSSRPVLTSVLVEGAVLLALVATWGYLKLWKRNGGAHNDAQPVAIAKDGARSQPARRPVAPETHDIASVPQWTPLLRSRDGCMDTRRSCVRWRTDPDAARRNTAAQTMDDRGRALDGAVPVRILGAGQYERLSPRGEADFTSRVLSAMRKEFGGHDEKRGSG